MKIYILTFTDVQTNEKQVNVYPTLKLAQKYMKSKRDDAISLSNTLDFIADESDYGCYVRDVCEASIEISYLNFHDFIAHKIVEHCCENLGVSSLYYDVIYNIVNDYNTEDYPNIDDKNDIESFINHKLLNTMAYVATKKMANGLELSYENFNKVVSYLYVKVGICDLSKIINGEMITQYQIQYDSEHPTETLFNRKKVWAASFCMYGGASFSPDFEFRLFDTYDDALAALLAKKNDILEEFSYSYDESDVIENLSEDQNSTTYEISEKEDRDDIWVGKVEVRYIE